MKKFSKLITICLVLSLVFIPFVMANGHPDGTTEVQEETDKVIPVSKCDALPIYSKDISTCFRCHNKDMSLKEIPLGAGTEFEGFIGEENGIKFIRFEINDMDNSVPNGLKKISDYISWHPEFTKVKIHVRSYGGSLMDCWDAIGIINEMKENNIIVETKVYGYGMSAGFVITTSGTFGHRYASKTANMMWHELSSWAWLEQKTPSKLKDEARIYRTLQDIIHSFLVNRSRGKVSHEFLDKAVNKDEWWVSGKVMFENGLVDHLIETSEK